MKIFKTRFATSMKIASYLMIQSLLFGPCQIGLAYDFNSGPSQSSTLAPQTSINSQVIQNFVLTSSNKAGQADIFNVSEENSLNEAGFVFDKLNSLSKTLASQDELIDFVLEDSEMERIVSSAIRAQDRMEDTQGLSIDRVWAEKFRNKALQKSVELLKDRDIFFLQMEYELSIQFMDAFEENLVRNYLMYDDGTPYEERSERAKQLAVYAKGQLAKLQMAGGLGSFKPDLVRGFYNTLKKFWGVDEARNKLNVMGIFYAKAIKGEGELVRDKKLNPVTEKIRMVKDIRNNVQDRIQGQSELVDVALETMDEVISFQVPVNMNGFGTVKVTVYSNPYSELHEYWMYCPEIFHEAYPGGENDEFRTVQTFVYREVLVRYVEYLAKSGKISNKIVISDSETSTALANPNIMDTDPENYPEQERDAYKNIFKEMSGFDVLYHHYNHTIVPAGMGSFPAWKFDDLKINKELSFVKQGEKLDLRMLVGETHDIITGCSTAHTQIMRDHPDLYKYFSYKIVEDDLFGNSEGSDVIRWQGKEIQMVVEIFMEDLKADTYEALFRLLENNTAKKNEFIQAVKVAKKMQKKRFINELFKGTFGEIDVTKEELEKDGVNLLDCPFFTFVRRMVPYKCSNFIIDCLENEQMRERIIKAKAVLVIGGRKFDDFADLQHRRIKKLIEKDPRLRSHIIFISNHNVATSWIIQQGTDFGGMLSWEGMEAGPTSPSNAGLNWTNLFSTPDGVMIERLRTIKRDAKGNVVSGTGHIVHYGKERANNAMQSRMPDKESFLREMEKGCTDYLSGADYDNVCFYNLWLQMTQGNIETQASGLLMVWADYLQQKQKDNAEWEGTIVSFVKKQGQQDIEEILYNSKNVNKFWFGFDAPEQRPESSGLKAFRDTLKYNTQQGFIYHGARDFIEYLKGVLKDKALNHDVVNMFENISSYNKYGVPLTYYEKQKEFIRGFDLLIDKLEDSLENKGIVVEHKKIKEKNFVGIAI